MKVSARELAGMAITGFGAMQKLDELAATIELIDTVKPAVIVEIGAGNGGTSWAWSKIASKALYTIDLPNGPWGGSDVSLMFDYIKKNTKIPVTYIPGNSREMVDTLKGHLASTMIDFLYIDGDHSYEGVKADYELYRPLVAPGGIIGFHDYCEHPKEIGCEVRRLCDELALVNPKNCYVFQEEPLNWGGVFMFINEPDGKHS